MGLLDELRKRAAEKEAQRASNVEDDARADEIRAVALPALFRIHTNLAELSSNCASSKRKRRSTSRSQALARSAVFSRATIPSVPKARRRAA